MGMDESHVEKGYIRIVAVWSGGKRLSILPQRPLEITLAEEVLHAPEMGTSFLLRPYRFAWRAGGQ